jgi:hypothetical protein
MGRFFCAAASAVNAGLAVHGLLTGGTPWVIALNVGVAVFCALTAFLYDKP